MRIVTISGYAESGKDTTAQILKELIEADGQKALIVHFADLVKFVCKEFFDWDGNKDEKGRTLLQEVGTDKVRAKHPDYWVDFISNMLEIFGDNWDWVLIPDTRFPNEIDKLKSDGFSVVHIRIQRDKHKSKLNPTQKKHASETALDDVAPDIWINNSGNVDFLKGLVADVYETIKLHKQDW